MQLPLSDIDATILTQPGSTSSAERVLLKRSLGDRFGGESGLKKLGFEAVRNNGIAEVPDEVNNVCAPADSVRTVNFFVLNCFF